MMQANGIQRNTLYFILILGTFLSACSSNEMYRSKHDKFCEYVNPGDCKQDSLQIYGSGTDQEYRLGFVEYDDQGQLRDPKQMKAVLNAYREISISEDVLLITFVHGWHHSAAPEDDNIASFRTMLTRLSQKEGLGSEQQDRSRRKILALYVGWRGDSIAVPGVNNVTFWDRKNTAHSVGQQGVTEVLLKLEEIRNVKAGMEEENPPPINSRMVVIGHSFGGAVVYSSLQKVLLDRFIDSRPGKIFSGNASGFGDLVVLLNPAFEALRFTALYDVSQEDCRGYFATQLPRLVVLTSEADLATKYAFPTGRFFSTMFESHTTLKRHYCTRPGSAGMQPVEIKEGQAARHTIGHFEPYQTHRLIPVEGQPLKAANLPVMQMQRDWSAQASESKLHFEGSQLVHKGVTVPLNPYLNVKVDEELIGGHNDIWGDEVINFIRDMIIISTTPQ